MTCKHRGRARSRPGEAAARIPRAIRGSHGGRGPWALPRWPRPTAAVPPQGEPVTIRDAGGRAPQNAVHVWSNIPAVRRYALALWAATRRGLQPAVASLPRAGAPKPRHAPVGDAASTPGTCSQLSHPCPRGPRLGPLQAGKAQPRHVPWGCRPHPYGPAHGRRPRTLTRTRSHARGAPWPLDRSRRPPGRGPSCAPFRGPGPSLPLAAGPRLPTPLWPLSRRALSPLPSGWLAAPLRPRPARPCADSADPASATAGSCVFPAGSPCSPSQPLGPGIACGAAKAGRLPERRLLGRKPGWSAVGAACVAALPRAPATSSPPPGSQNPRAGPPGAHCRSHMLWQAQHPAETPPTAWPPLRPAGCPGLVPAGGPACFWHLVCGLRLPK